LSNIKQTLYIELPPEGTLSKDLVHVAVNLLLVTQMVNVQQLGSTLRIDGNLSVALNTVSNAIHNIMELKRNKKIRWPPLHQNDKGTLKKSPFIASKIDSMNTYGDLIEEYAKVLPNLAKLNSVKFSDGDIALLQLLKVEFYETGLTYNKPYRYKTEFRTNDYMLSLILAGLAAAYTGYIEVLVPSVLGDVCTARTYLAVELAGISMGRIASEPVIPYVFYNHVIVHKLASKAYQMLPGISDVSEVIDPSKGFCLDFASFIVHRLSFDGKTYTKTSREEIRISKELLDFVSKIDRDNCLEEFTEFVRMASRTENTTALNSLVLLYEAVNKASDPAYASYYLSRVLTDIRSETGRVPIGSRCLELLLKALLS